MHRRRTFLKYCRECISNPIIKPVTMKLSRHDIISVVYTAEGFSSERSFSTTDKAPIVVLWAKDVEAFSEFIVHKVTKRAVSTLGRYLFLLKSVFVESSSSLTVAGFIIVMFPIFYIFFSDVVLFWFAAIYCLLRTEDKMWLNLP